MSWPLPAVREEDEWGYEPRFVTAAEPALGLLYDRWWRVTATGTEHLPAAGRVLVVANHAGVVPWDGAMVATAIRRATGRQPRALVLDWAFSLPWVASVVRRTGGVPASPANAQALLEADHAVVVFPEGTKGLGKPWRSRYRLERFGRGGFVEVALRTGAPIVPCAVVGSEEVHPKLAELPGVARLLRAPYVPVTPTFPLLGPLGLVPLPSRWRIAFGAPVDVGTADPSAPLAPRDAGDAARVLDLTEAVRARVQEMVYDELVQRGGAFP